MWDYVNQLDEGLFRWFNGLLELPVWSTVFYYLALYGIALFLIMAVWLWYMPGDKKDDFRHKKTVVLAGLTVLLTLLAEQLFDLLIARPRPYIVYDNVVSFNVLQDAASFPSLHVAVTFGFATILWFMRYRWLSAISFILAFLIGISRVVTGVHYPTDIVAGAFLGVLAASVIWYEAAWLRQYLPTKQGKSK